MSQRDDAQASAHPRSHERVPASRRWLYVAVLFSVAALVLAGGLLVGLFGAFGDDEVGARESNGDELVIAIGRAPGGASEWRTYVALIDHISEELDRPVRVLYLTDRESAIELFALGEADAGLICTGSYLKLANRGVVNAVAVPITAGATTERAMLLVRSDSDIEGLEDLAGRSVAVASKTSVSGAGFLYWLCAQNQIEPRQFFGTIQINDTQEQSLRQLANGDVDATVGCTTELARYEEGTFRVLAESPDYALPPFVVSADLDGATAAALEEAVLSFEAPDIPEASEVSGFLPVTRTDYDVMFELMEYSPFWRGE